MNDSPQRKLTDSGGTHGGLGLFMFGLALCALSLWFFFDSVHVTTGHFGAISRALGHGRGGGFQQTTSMGIVFVPFFLGVVLLFYNAKLRAGWALTWIGLAIIVIEALSSLRFEYKMKLSLLILMMLMFAAGAGMILRSYKDFSSAETDTASADTEPTDAPES